MPQLDAQPLLKSYEIKEFLHSHNISDRETDVFLLLLNGVTTTSEISQRLGLSPNTVSNHLNSLLTKTSTKNKTELLARYLKLSQQKLEAAKLLCRAPRLLVIDPDMKSAQLLAQNLQMRGFRAECPRQQHDVVQIAAQICYDSIIIVDYPGTRPAAEIVKELRESLQHLPPCIVLTESAAAIRELDTPVAAILTKPADYNCIAFNVLDALIESPRVKNRFYRVEVELDGTINGIEPTRLANIGLGGACFALPRSRMLKERTLRKGRRVPFSIQLDEKTTIAGQADICWTRKKDQLGQKAGLGVRFLDLTDADKRKLRSYVSSQKFLALVDI